MPTYTEQIQANVQRLVDEGVIEAQYRDSYVDLFTKNPKAQERFAGVLSMDRDYTHKSQANAQWRREQEVQITQERRRVQEEEARLRQWEQEARAEMQRLQASQLTPETAARLAALETVVANYNLGEAVTVPPVARPAAPLQPPTQPSHTPQGAPVMPQQPSDYLSREEGVGALRDLTAIYSQALVVNNEHFALFGKPLTDDLVTESINTGRPVRDIYEAKYNPAGRRAELAKQNEEAERARVRAEIEAQVRAEYATDPGRAGLGYGQAAAASQGQFFELAASRAQVDPATGKPVAAAPEMIPLGQQQRTRVQNALEMLHKNFDPATGQRRQPGGPAQGY